MSPMIQALEQRMMLSVTAQTLTNDAAALLADSKALAATSSVRTTTVSKDFSLISVKVKPLDPTMSLTLKQLRQQVTHYNAFLTGDATRLEAAAKTAASGASSGIALLKKPTSATLLKAVNKDVAYINSKLRASVNALLPELTDALIDGFVSYNTSISEVERPALASLIDAIDNDVTTKTNAVTSATNQLQTDASQLASDLSAI